MTIDPAKTYTAIDQHELRRRSRSTLDAKTAPIATNNFVFARAKTASTTACRSTAPRRTS